jgi:hypothetical protein
LLLYMMRREARGSLNEKLQKNISRKIWIQRYIINTIHLLFFVIFVSVIIYHLQVNEVVKFPRITQKNSHIYGRSTWHCQITAFWEAMDQHILHTIEKHRLLNLSSLVFNLRKEYKWETNFARIKIFIPWPGPVNPLQVLSTVLHWLCLYLR